MEDEMDRGSFLGIVYVAGKPIPGAAQERVLQLTESYDINRELKTAGSWHETDYFTGD
jgi:hypothetical protein